MTGDGDNNIHIPIVLMFKDEAFQLLHFLSLQPNLIIYIGDENYLIDSFYQQINYLESLIEPFDGITNKWIYGQLEFRQCSMIPKKLEQLELTIKRQIEHIIQASKKNIVLTIGWDL